MIKLSNEDVKEVMEAIGKTEKIGKTIKKFGVLPERGVVLCAKAFNQRIEELYEQNPELEERLDGILEKNRKAAVAFASIYLGLDILLNSGSFDVKADEGGYILWPCVEVMTKMLPGQIARLWKDVCEDCKSRGGIPVVGFAEILVMSDYKGYIPTHLEKDKATGQVVFIYDDDHSKQDNLDDFQAAQKQMAERTFNTMV